MGVEMAKNFFTFVAEEVREWMAAISIRSISELIGRVDLLEVKQGTTTKHGKLDLSPILHTDALLDSKPQYCQVERNVPFDPGAKDEEIVAEVLPAIEAKTGGEYEFTITNCDRSIGARVSGEIAQRYGNSGMNDAPIKLNLRGVAGQSFGVWNAGGLEKPQEIKNKRSSKN